MHNPPQRRRPPHQSLLNLRFLIAKHAAVPTHVVERVLVGEPVSTGDQEAVSTACRRLGIKFEVAPPPVQTSSEAAHPKGRR